jgi:hypothetical protein
MAEILTAEELKILAQVFFMHSKQNSVLEGINELSSLPSSKEASTPLGKPCSS